MWNWAVVHDRNVILDAMSRFFLMDVWKCIHSSHFPNFVIFIFVTFITYKTNIKNNKMGRIMPTEENKAVWLY